MEVRKCAGIVQHPLKKVGRHCAALRQCRQEGGPRRVLRGQIWRVEQKPSANCDRDVAMDSRRSDRESERRVGLARLTHRAGRVQEARTARPARRGRPGAAG